MKEQLLCRRMRIVKFILTWLALTLFFCVFNYANSKFEFLIQATNSILFTSGFYFSYHVLIKTFLYKRRVRSFFTLYLLFILLLSAISMISIYEIYVWQGNKFFVDAYWKEPVFYMSSYILMLLVISTLLSFRFLNDKMQTQLQLENIEKEKVSAELSFLKGQINPHFLFNSLNNILFLIDKSNREARDTLLKFSEMLRYQLYDCSSDFIEIEKELQYIKNYVEIQILRKSDKYKCELKVSDSVKNFSIAPLLVTPLIENAFKYLSNHTTKNNSISISLDYKEGVFTFKITNDTDNSIPVNIDESKGIGIANVKRRLNLIYNDKHNFEIINTGDSYTVSMTLVVA
jgi:two-component system LytT family sensor kinase